MIQCPSVMGPCPVPGPHNGAKCWSASNGGVVQPTHDKAHACMCACHVDNARPRIHEEWCVGGEKGPCNCGVRPAEVAEQPAEAVEHPAHYGGKDNPYEAIKVIEAWGLGFCLGNTVKYIARAGHKGKRLEDLKKAAWYLAREIANEEEKT